MNKYVYWTLAVVGAVCIGAVVFFAYPVVLRLKTTSQPTPAQTVAQNAAVFSPKEISWTEATPAAPWQPRDSAVSFVFKDRLWTAGGLNGNKNVNSAHVVLYWEAPHFNDIWSTADGVTWRLEAEHAQWPARRSMSVVPFKDKLFLFGGWSPVSGYSNDIWESLDGITWKRVLAHAAWPAREGQTTEVFDGKIWMMGGVNYDKRETKNDIWYSEDGVTWVEAVHKAPWSSRWDHAVAAFNGKLFLVGGMNLQGATFKDTWVSADGISWELVSDNPPWQARQGLALLVFRDLLWMVGRLNDVENGGVNDIWFSSDGVAWQKTNIDPPWLGREDHSALVYNDRIFVFGGMDATWQWRNDVWVSSQ